MEGFGAGFGAGMGCGMCLGIAIGCGAGSSKYSSGYDDGQKELSNTIQKLCEERQITLQGRDPGTGKNIAYKIGEILDQAMQQAEE
jgi:hypothetical protein